MPHPSGITRTPLTGQIHFGVEYDPDTHEVVLLDQRKLPHEADYRRFSTVDEVAVAIREMVVRGAPAIGITAAYGLVLQARKEDGDAASFLVANGIAARALGGTRPTAVNLQWALNRMSAKAAKIAGAPIAQRAALMQQEAEALHREDAEACDKIATNGAALLPEKAQVLTHCHAGIIATGGCGTALGVISAGHKQGKVTQVFADETRPYLQGARLTSWELNEQGIPVHVITDSMAGHLMAQGEIDCVVTGADRICRNGDVANKIGTFSIAVLANYHKIPLYVAAPWSTIDMHTSDGSTIPIEERSRDEVAKIGNYVAVADGIHCRHPAFDVTPAPLVEAIITERGVVRPRGAQTTSNIFLTE